MNATVAGVRAHMSSAAIGDDIGGKIRPGADSGRTERTAAPTDAPMRGGVTKAVPVHLVNPALRHMVREARPAQWSPPILRAKPPLLNFYDRSLAPFSPELADAVRRAGVVMIEGRYHMPKFYELDDALWHSLETTIGLESMRTARELVQIYNKLSIVYEVLAVGAHIWNMTGVYWTKRGEQALANLSPLFDYYIGLAPPPERSSATLALLQQLRQAVASSLTLDHERTAQLFIQLLDRAFGDVLGRHLPVNMDLGNYHSPLMRSRQTIAVTMSWFDGMPRIDEHRQVVDPGQPTLTPAAIDEAIEIVETRRFTSMAASIAEALGDVDLEDDASDPGGNGSAIDGAGPADA